MYVAAPLQPCYRPRIAHHMYSIAARALQFAMVKNMVACMCTQPKVTARGNTPDTYDHPWYHNQKLRQKELTSFISVSISSITQLVCKFIS